MKILGIVLALLVFSFIIIFHEFGHYLLARLNDVQVNEFTLGFGPTIIGKKVGETLFAWKLLPFGGSCAMEGEDDESESSRAFCKKKVWQRFSIVFAGPLFNFILAYILAAILLICAGVDMPVLSGVAEGSAAESAGLKEGERITSLNGHHVFFYRDITLYMLTHNGQTTDVTYVRNGVKDTVTLVPQYSEENGRYLLGIYGSAVREKVNPIKALGYGFCEVRYWISYVIESLKMMVTGKVSANEISGPVGIVQVIGDTVTESSQDGAFYVFLNLLNISILLSANLGVMNLLPFPALDGGRLVFYIIEAIRRKKCDPRIENGVNFVGIMLLFGLMFLIMFNDVRKIFIH